MPTPPLPAPPGPNPSSTPPLLGRERERALVDRILENARAGVSDVVVLRGEAGIGKSALLDYAAARAGGMTVVRAVGVESEAELEFSGLLDVCRPLLGQLPGLPAPQAGALRSALGLASGEAVDRFAIGAAVLGLLGAAAVGAPLVVLVDDAQWLDRSSADALLFAARRLDSEAVAVLFAVRDGAGCSFDAPGLTEFVLEGLAPAAAAALLASRSPVPVASEVAERIYAVTRGNPLAALELPAHVPPEQLTGREPLAEPLPAGASVQRAFCNRVEALPPASRAAVLVAAVSPSAELEPVLSALAQLGVAWSALEPVEDAGLLRIEGDSIAFRHPLVRSAVFHGAAPSERRAAHRALADALEGAGRDDQRAWHLAAAALGRDADAAAALAEAARRTLARSGYAGAATAFERAARLTPDDELRRRRLHEAAEAAWLGGRKQNAIDLVEEALAGADDPELRARMLHLRGHIERIGGSVPKGVELLLEAADLAEPHEPARAVAILAEAVHAAVHAGAPGPALEAGLRARALAPRDGSAADFRAEFALGQALFVNERAGEGEATLLRALDLLAARPELADDPVNLIAGSIAAGMADRAAEGIELAERAMAAARDRGDFASLHRAIAAAGANARRAGRWREAYAYATETVARARECDETTIVFHTLTHLAAMDAARGDELRCRARVAEAIELGVRIGVVTEWPERLLAVLDLGLGRLEDAAARLEALERSAGDRGYFVGGAGELVETYSRLGDRERAQAAFERWLASDARASSVEAAATAERSRGLLAGDDEYEQHFREALRLQLSIGEVFGAARTRFCLGERLRRAGRRIDARRELRAALAAFEQLEATPWAERTRTELRASGETLRRREPHEGEELTPQERQIAAHVAQGKTNKEVAAALFLSPKTVDFHLRRVFRKLAVRSRGELIRQYAEKSTGVDFSRSAA
jgi:DNA-binding CsgD family transcriptional regulator